MARKVDELFDAAFEGRGDDVVQILATDLSLIQIGDALGDTAFHVAARAGHADTVLKMIEFLNEVDSKMLTDVLRDGNRHGDTAFHVVARAGHVATVLKMVEFLDKGDSIMVTRVLRQWNEQGDTPLHLAIKNRHKENEDQVSLLEGFAKRPSPDSALCDIEMRMAALSDNEDDNDDDEDKKEYWITVEDEDEDEDEDDDDKKEWITLWDEDEDDDDENKKRLRSIYEAAVNGKIGFLKKMVRIVESRNELKRQMLGGNVLNSTPLHVAVEGGQEKTARYLVDLEPRATYIVNFNGESPLYMAVKRGYTDLVRHMVRPNLSLSIRDRILKHAKKNLLAHTALKERNPAVFQALMEGLPELINLPDKKGWKLLSYAAYKGYLDEVCYILNNYPDSIAKHDEDGSLPIHKAVAGGHVSIVREFILRCPRARHDVDKKCRNLIELATLYHSKDVVSYLQERN